jgi:hypothetical protein
MKAGGTASRRVVAAAAALSAAVAVTGVVVVVRGSRGTDVDRLVAAAPAAVPTSPTPTRTPAGASPTPDRKRGTHAPRPAATVQPVDEPTTAAPSSPTGTADGYSSGLGPMPPGSVVVPYHDGQHHWSGVSDGISIDIRMSPDAPRTGEQVAFTITMSADRDCCAPYMVFGNGYIGGDGDCQSPHQNTTTVTFTTYYNSAGRHDFLTSATAGSCSRQQGTLYGTVDIAEGTHSAQGPAAPQVAFDTSLPPPGHKNDPGWLTLDGGGSDADGYVQRLVVDWGDGNTEAFTQALSDCVEGRDGWPAESELRLPPYGDTMAMHHYRHTGSYTVRLIAISVSCDGRDDQRAIARLTYDYSG